MPMKSSKSQVVPAIAQQAPEIGITLGRAFHHDPIQGAMFPNEAKRAEVLPIVFAAFTRATLRSGGRVTTTPDVAAAALWSPPGLTLSTFDVIRSYGWDWPRIIARTPLPTVPATMTVFGTMAKRRKELVPEPHWYLAALGVDPERQGEGLGTMLVRDGLGLADADGVRTYVETETEGNVEFYRSLGFEVLEEIVLGRIDLPMWLMVRTPE